jgi:hypothetical protein
MSKLLRGAVISVTLGLTSVAAMANGHVTWSVGVNLPPAQVVVGNGYGYYDPPQTVYRVSPPPVYYQPAPVYYQPPPVVYRPAPVYGHPPSFGGWVHQRPPQWHHGQGHGHGRGWRDGGGWQNNGHYGHGR